MGIKDAHEMNFENWLPVDLSKKKSVYIYPSNFRTNKFIIHVYRKKECVEIAQIYRRSFFESNLHEFASGINLQ